jgi:hypothetical protein
MTYYPPAPVLFREKHLREKGQMRNVRHLRVPNAPSLVANIGIGVASVYSLPATLGVRVRCCPAPAVRAARRSASCTKPDSLRTLTAVIDTPTLRAESAFRVIHRSAGRFSAARGSLAAYTVAAPAWDFGFSGSIG